MAKVILILFVLIGSALYALEPIPPSNIESPNAGSTLENPLLISNFGNLIWLSENPSYWGSGDIVLNPALNFVNVVKVYYQQTNDIDASDSVFLNDGYGLKPIGNADLTDPIEDLVLLPFLGEYDGGGYSIDGLFIMQGVVPETYESLALFGWSWHSNIRNLHLTNAQIITDGVPNAGVLAGYIAYTTILNCSTTGNITGAGGSMDYVTYLGGLVGRSVTSTIDRCFSFASVYSENCTTTGGIIGALENSSTLQNSFFRGSINGSYDGFGGYSGMRVGGVAGHVIISTINNVYVSTFEPTPNVGGVIGLISATNVRNSFWNTETSEVSDGYLIMSNDGTIQNLSGKTSAELRDIATFESADWDFNNIWVISPDNNNGYPYLQSKIPPVSEIDIVVLINTATLHANYPNPFNPSTTISFEIFKTGNVCIEVFNVKGQMVKILTNETYIIGHHQVVWNGLSDDGRSMSSGIYFYRMTTNDSSQTRRMALIK